MFNKKTLIVVGAGASKEVDMPTGKELKEIIADALNYEFNNSSLIKGDRLIYEAIHQIRIKESNVDVNKYFRAGRAIHD